VLHCPIRQLLSLLAVACLSTGPALGDPLTLNQGGRYDHNNEITVCLSSDNAKTFYETFEGANVYTTGCFPAKLGSFSPMYRVENISMTSETGIVGFVYGISGSVMPRMGAILYGVPIYIVTSATVVDRDQKEVLVTDLN
jgi:hypothetical protein